MSFKIHVRANDFDSFSLELDFYYEEYPMLEYFIFANW